MSNSWKGGSTRAHRKARAYVLARDAGTGCRAHVDGWCARASDRPHRCTGVATQAHHTHGKAATGDDPAHMVAACQNCNLHIGDPAKGGDPQPRPRTRWA
jgi:hypothetical protein